MYHRLRIALTSSIVLKLQALCMGCALWVLLGSLVYTTKDVSVPLCFYNVPDTMRIIAPDTVTVRLSGCRNNLYMLDVSTIAAHYDARLLTPGESKCVLSDEHFFLPSTISVVHCLPSSCTINCSV